MSWLATLPPSDSPLWSGAGVDKLFHAAEYAVLGALLARAWRRRGGRAVAAIVLCAALHGSFDEWRQGRTPGRRAEAADVAADVLGAALGAGVHGCARRSRRARRARGFAPRGAP